MIESLGEPDHSENGDNVIDSQAVDFVPDSQSGSSCTYNTGSEISHFKSVKSTQEGSFSAGASDESYKHENSKFAGIIRWSIDPASWPGVMYRNVRSILAQIGPPTFTT